MCHIFHGFGTIFLPCTCTSLLYFPEAVWVRIASSSIGNSHHLLQFLDAVLDIRAPREQRVSLAYRLHTEYHGKLGHNTYLRFQSFSSMLACDPEDACFQDAVHDNRGFHVTLWCCTLPWLHSVRPFSAERTMLWKLILEAIK